MGEDRPTALDNGTQSWQARTIFDKMAIRHGLPVQGHAGRTVVALIASVLIAYLTGDSDEGLRRAGADDELPFTSITASGGDDAA